MLGRAARSTTRPGDRAGPHARRHVRARPWAHGGGMTTLHQRGRTVSRDAAELLAGVAALTLVTWVAVRLDASVPTAALLYIALAVLVSLRGRLVPALVVSLAGVG